MSVEKYSFDYRRYTAREVLPEQERLLCEKAGEACATSFSPYSNFKVGAAILFEDGEILVSSNQESEVFPSGICAERSLLYYVQANRRGKRITALAIASEPTDRECYPCGACRQVIVDTERRQNTPIRVIMCSAQSATVIDRAELLLPFTFKL